MENVIEAQCKAKSAAIRPFTAESLEKIKQRIAAEKEQAADEAQKSKDAKAVGVRPRRPAAAGGKKAAATREYPNPALETGKKIPDKLGDFPRDLYGQPIEDLDDFYSNKYVSVLFCHRRRRRVVIGSPDGIHKKQ